MKTLCWLRAWPLLLILAVDFLVVCASARDNSGPRIYSNVQLEEGAMELVGTELELKIEGTAASGVLRIYYGRCAEPVQVTGTASGENFHVTGEGQGYGKIDITGNVHRGRVDGVLRLDRNHSSEKIRLKRISKPHC
jgi:hypothetical protein